MTTKPKRTHRRGKFKLPLQLNLLSNPKYRYRVKLDLTVGGENLDDAVDAVCLMLQDYCDKFFEEIKP